MSEVEMNYEKFEDLCNLFEKYWLDEIRFTHQGNFSKEYHSLNGNNSFEYSMSSEANLVVTDIDFDFGSLHQDAKLIVDVGSDKIESRVNTDRTITLDRMKLFGLPADNFSQENINNGCDILERFFEGIEERIIRFETLPVFGKRQFILDRDEEEKNEQTRLVKYLMNNGGFGSYKVMPNKGAIRFKHAVDRTAFSMAFPSLHTK